MIRELFLPEKIGTRRILSQRIVGISINETTVNVVCIFAKRSKTIIESIFSEPIAIGTDESNRDLLVQTLKKAIARIPAYDHIRISIPASIVVFKELQMHFTDPEKIRMVLDYEIEGMLPFSIADAITDFIITKVDTATQTTQVLAAAVRTSNLQEHLDLYAQAGINPTSVTIDLFALYGLYQQIPDYASLKNAVALVDIGQHVTRIAFINDGQLRITRTIQRGYISTATLIAEELKIHSDDCLKMLAEKGISGVDDASARVIQNHLILLLNDIQFTLNSFSLKLNQSDGIAKVLFIGATDSIKNFLEFCSNTLQMSCEILDGKQLLSHKIFKNKVKNSPSQWNLFDVALGTAIQAPQQNDFDLRRKQFAYHGHGIIFRQLIAASTLTIIIFSTILVMGYLDISKLSSHATMIEQREINKFKTEGVISKEKFPKKPTLMSVVKAGERSVKEKSEMWAPLQHTGMKPLELWLEVTRIADKRLFDVAIKELAFSTKDGGALTISVEGVFKSKTGNHFVDFQVLENKFKESSLLQLVDKEDGAVPEGGVNFTFKLKPKEA